jgi:hypothetical protein
LDVIASQLGHRDLRMTKRYARIASSQVKQAVNGLDSLLQTDESHTLITEQENQPEGKTLGLLT